MLVSRTVISVAVESAYNDPTNPSEAPINILVENPSLAFEGLRMAERNPTSPSLAAVEKIQAGALMTLTFDAEVKGSGDVVTDPVPEIGRLLRGCGFSQETAGLTNGVVYRPASEGHVSLTIRVFQDGMLFTLTGCRGTVTANLAVGEVGKLSFTFSGHYTGTSAGNSPVDSPLPTPTFNSTLPPPVVGAGLSIAGILTRVAAEVTFDMGLEVAKPVNISASDGFGEVQITKRAVTGTVNPEAYVPGTPGGPNDIYEQLRTNTLLNITTGWIGSDADSRYRVNFPKAQLTDITQGDREAIRTFDLTFSAIEDLGDDEIAIFFGNDA